MKKTITFKKRMSKLTILLLFVMPIFSFAQPNNFHWKLGGNINTGIDAVNTSNNILGTKVNLPIRIITNDILRGIFTTGNTFGSGDGLRLTSPGNCNNYLDMWAEDSGCETTVKFHVNGRVVRTRMQKVRLF